jgi:hypothetical protein
MVSVSALAVVALLSSTAAFPTRQEMLLERTVELPGNTSAFGIAGHQRHSLQTRVEPFSPNPYPASSQLARDDRYANYNAPSSRFPFVLTWEFMHRSYQLTTARLRRAQHADDWPRPAQKTRCRLEPCRLWPTRTTHVRVLWLLRVTGQ